MWSRAEVRGMFARRVRSDKMFAFIDETWNPVKGCLHACRYCYAPKYTSGARSPRLEERELARRFRPGSFIFISDLGDLFGGWVPVEWIDRVVEVVRRHPDTLFLALTKNPARYHELVDRLPANVVLGSTVETDLDHVAAELSQAPAPSARLEAMRVLKWPAKFISVEPVLRFSSPEEFASKILSCEPIAVAVGYDNHGHRLPEPPLRDVEGLIGALEASGVLVVRKTLRQAWWEG